VPLSTFRSTLRQILATTTVEETRRAVMEFTKFHLEMAGRPAEIISSTMTKQSLPSEASLRLPTITAIRRIFFPAPIHSR
jgi:hypothetical protein